MLFYEENLAKSEKWEVRFTEVKFMKSFEELVLTAEVISSCAG